MSQPALGQAALEHAARGFAVFPLQPRGKEPLGRLAPNGLKNATRDREIIARWWQEEPGANIGIATGDVSGIVVLDVDCARGRDGFGSLKDFPVLPETFQVETGSGGRHFFFTRSGPLRNSSDKLGPGLDVRADGGYVVASPSIHPSGKPYSIVLDAPLAACPEWIGQQEKARPATREMPFTSDLTVRIERARRYLAKIPGAVSGEHGHDRTFVTALKVGPGFDLPPEVALQLMQEWNAKCEPPWSEKELRHKIEDADRLATERGFLLKGSRAKSELPAEPPPPDDRDAPDTRPMIVIGPEEAAIVDQAEKAIAGSTPLFQRAGLLVHVRRDLASPRFLRRPAGAPQIAPLTAPTCRELLSRVARFMKVDGRTHELRQVRPPGFVAEDLIARGEWAHIRPLTAVIESSIMRPDGTVLAMPGYDHSTGLLLEPTSPLAPVPEFPSREDAFRARDALLEVVANFPFATEAHRSAWLAAVLTYFARFAIVGRVPLTLFEAPAAGTGKTLLADTIGVICTGRELAKMANTLDDAEMRKRLLAIALAGDSIVLFDNVRGGFGTPSLDMALTAGLIRDRILGVSEEKTVPLDSIFFASGNNVELLGDTRRRVLHCRIDARVERPEERDGFEHPDLLAWIGTDRPRLVSAALTILRAFHLAGRPVVGKVRPWGSFEGWQSLVCGAVRWLDLTAPEDTRTGLVQAESEPERLGTLLRAWQAGQPSGGMMAAEALKRAAEVPALNEAIAATCRPRGGGEPTPESIGYYLRRVRGRVIGGLCFNQGKSEGDRHWFAGPPITDGGDGGDFKSTREKVAGQEEILGEGDQGSPPSPPSVGVPTQPPARMREPGEDDDDLPLDLAGGCPCGQ